MLQTEAALQSAGLCWKRMPPGAGAGPLCWTPAGWQSCSRATTGLLRSLAAAVPLVWRYERPQTDMATRRLGYGLACRVHLPACRLVTALNLSLHYTYIHQYRCQGSESIYRLAMHGVRVPVVMCKVCMCLYLGPT